MCKYLWCEGWCTSNFEECIDHSSLLLPSFIDYFRIGLTNGCMHLDTFVFWIDVFILHWVAYSKTDSPYLFQTVVQLPQTTLSLCRQQNNIYFIDSDFKKEDIAVVADKIPGSCHFQISIKVYRIYFGCILENLLMLLQTYNVYMLKCILMKISIRIC